MNRLRRIAVGSIFTESNHLASSRTTLADFKRTELRRGPEILEVTGGVIGGVLSVLGERAATIEPLLAASAFPGGILTEDCYLELKQDLIGRLEKALPLDGVILPLHGAAAAERTGDVEGDLLAAVRQCCGPNVPLVATLDCHAHVTGEMVAQADALLAWETYPHRDTFETGARGARLLFDMIEGKIRPAMALAKVPVIVSGFKGGTDPPGAFADVMGFAKSLESRDDVVSTSALLVHPHLDLPEMGGGGLVITDGDLGTAEKLAAEIARRHWDRRFDLETTGLKPAEAIGQGMKIAGGPVLLLELSDCVGGGAAGDSVATLAALLRSGIREPCLAMVADPEAAAACHRAGEGREVTLRLGHKIDPRWGRPIKVTGRVERLSNGGFLYSGGIWGGQRAEMGPSAKITTGAVEILITTHGTYDWADEQYASLGMDAGRAKFVVVKNPMNYRVGYAGRSKGEIVLDTPGPTTAILSNIEYQRLQRPYFPADRGAEGAQPVVYSHAMATGA